jgi:ABC-type polysaccharide/polyol phosphate export permease
LSDGAISASGAGALEETRPASPAGRLRGRLGRSVDVLAALTASDLRARYGRGPFQLLKWLLDPFALVGVYLLLITFVLNRSGPAPGLSLACAVVPFQLVMGSIISSMNCIAQRRSIILNMGFDRMLIPVSAVLTETIAFGASMVLLALMMVVYTVPPTVAILWLPVLLLVTIAFSMSCAYPVTLIGLWFPELRVFFVSLVRTLYFVAPGLIALSEITGRAHDLIRINPLTGLFEAFRDILLYGQRPAAWELLIPLGFAVVLLVAFVPVYRRDQVHFAKVVE